MSTARDLMRALESAGAAEFSSTRVAADLSPVTGRVRRHRAVRAGVGAAAGIAVLGGGYAAASSWQWRHSVAPAVGGAVESVAASPSASPVAPSGTLDHLVTEGERVEWTVAALSEHYRVSEDDAEAALVDALPPEAEGNPEGWVAGDAVDLPATVDEAARMLVDLQVQNLTSVGVEREDWLATLTLASLLVEEGPDPEDWTRISTVLRNRLDANTPLQIDSPLYYTLGADDQQFSTDDQRSIQSVYNTYANRGLPPTPISTPGLAAIDAATHPEAGGDFYFIIDPTTDRALFAADYAAFLEHVETVRVAVTG